MAQNSYHALFEEAETWVEVLLPLYLSGTLTYHVPTDFEGGLPQFGVRVSVPLRGKEYSGIITEVHNRKPDYKTKPILQVLDEFPVILPFQWTFWQWIAEYYCCSPGEVMNMSLPAHLKLTSETRFVANPDYEGDILALDDQAYLVAEALQNNVFLTLKDLQVILQRKKVDRVTRLLLSEGVLLLEEALEDRFKPKTVECVRWNAQYETQLNAAFDLLSRAPKQEVALLAFLELGQKSAEITMPALVERSGIDRATVMRLVEKGILDRYDKVVSRLGLYTGLNTGPQAPDEQQIGALAELNTIYETLDVALLHGITGSGKTTVYIEKIREVIASGRQCLFLLPEIALSVQLTVRLQRVFGDDLMVYHSRMNNNERVEKWQEVISGKPVILGVRSALLLPFKDLGLIIVDEEHDSSYKQHDPAPRYQARDSAIILAHMLKAKVLLGTATPAVETYYNVIKGKFGLVKMDQRHGGFELPKFDLVDLRKSFEERKGQGYFSTPLLDALKSVRANKKQSILFQNRRGFAPTMQCTACGYVFNCPNCDVSLTYHKWRKVLTCHFCNHSTELFEKCIACTSTSVKYQGFGTERIEDEIKIYLPDAEVDRLDLDTTRSKESLSRVIQDFEDGKTHILVGTQMVTKGLDFENVALVGVLQADQLMAHPDFRSTERTYQLITQVAGRAGRKGHGGQVIVQTFKPDHPIFGFLATNDYLGFFRSQLAERQQFDFPPFKRLIKIIIRHTKPDTVNLAGRIFHRSLSALPKEVRIDGPFVPSIGRINNLYILEMLLRMPASASVLKTTKKILSEQTIALQQEKGLSGVRFTIDVDPYF
jgi:primosomal protein N' (replication factor Y) (superfamily II helicase)